MVVKLQIKGDVRVNVSPCEKSEEVAGEFLALLVAAARLIIDSETFQDIEGISLHVEPCAAVERGEPWARRRVKEWKFGSSQ